MQYWQLLISQHLAGALGIAPLTQNNGDLDMHEPTVLVCHTYCYNMLLAKKKYSLHMCKVKAQHFEVSPAAALVLKLRYLTGQTCDNL
jgi:hypothetical protein